MKFSILQEFPNSMSKALIFKGINKKEIIEDTELSDGINLDSEMIPALSPRKPIKAIRKLSIPTYFGIVNGKHYFIDGTDFYYDGINKGTLTRGRKSIVDFNGNLVIFPDKKYYNYIEGEWGSFESPDIDYATVHYNRIFGIKGSDVRASKVGDFKAWEEFGGTELDSWAADVYSPGDFTGITSYQDHVIFFKRDQMYELYGYIPSQFKIIESAKIGCIDNESISEVGGILFFMSEKGVQTYSGGFPRDVSEKLNLSHVNKASSIGDGRKYYVSINGITYIYDTWQNAWYPYLDKEFICFSRMENEIYGLSNDRNIYKFEDGEETVKWYATTKLFDDGLFNKKSIKAIKLRARMDIGAEIKVYVSLDEGDFKLRKHIKNTEMYHKKQRDMRITIPISRSSTYQIKLKGRGNSIVYGEKEILVGSDR